MVRALVAVLVALALCLLWSGRITGSPIGGDAGQGLRMALSLERQGVMSLRLEAPFTPSMYREPLPVVVTAGVVRLHDAVYGESALEAYFSGPAARYLKLQNLGWMLLLCAGVYLAVRHLTGSVWLALLGIALLNVKLPLLASGFDYLGLDELETDLPAAALLAFGSAMLSLGMHRRNPLVLGLCGLTFGALALTKAAFLYVFVVLALFLIGTSIAAWARSLGRRAIIAPLVGVACFVLVVSGWMYRNYVQFGVFEVSERGGVVLLIRAFKDEMTPLEFRGAFYVWAPSALQPWIGKMLGFGEADLQRGGSLQRLNRTDTSDFYQSDYAAERAGRPDLAVSYYRKARAERVRVRAQLYSSGADPALADEILKEEALGIIRAKPVDHLRLTLAFLWRGALIAFPVLMFAWAYSISRRRPDLYWLVLPALGLVLFYGVLSHFIPRYGVPMNPIVICAAVALAHAAWKRWGPAG